MLSKTASHNEHKKENISETRKNKIKVDNMYGWNYL